MKTVLITGYNGFIGKNLVSELEKNHILIGISNCKTKGYQIKHISGDITTIDISKIKSKIHYIIHLAAMTDVSLCQKDPVKCFQINVNGTQNVLELAKQKKSKVIFVSSSHVYGNPRKLPISEKSETKPVTVYGFSKLSAEIMCEYYSRNYGVDISIMRLFSVYGKRHNGHDVISRIISQLDNPNVKLGNLFPKRDFVYVADVIAAFKLLLKNTTGFNIYNIGTGTSTSIHDVCKIIGKLQKQNLSVKPVTTYSRSVEIRDMRANISKIKKLGWKPRISIYDGLKQTLQI